MVRAARSLGVGFRQVGGRILHRWEKTAEALRRLARARSDKRETHGVKVLLERYRHGDSDDPLEAFFVVKGDTRFEYAVQFGTQGIAIADRPVGSLRQGRGINIFPPAVSADRVGSHFVLICQ